MKPVLHHVSRCLIAGVVALLPVAGVVWSVVVAEQAVAGAWLGEQSFYFPGLGLLVVVAALYVIGLVFSTMIGQWLWLYLDRLLERLPMLGRLYQTLKQILGYGQGPDALFKRVVLIPSRDAGGHEFALVTAEADASGVLTVFVPTAPNPMAGRLVRVEASHVTAIQTSVSETLRHLVALGSV